MINQDHYSHRQHQNQKLFNWPPRQSLLRASLPRCETWPHLRPSSTPATWLVEYFKYWSNSYFFCLTSMSLTHLPWLCLQCWGQRCLHTSSCCRLLHQFCLTPIVRCLLTALPKFRDKKKDCFQPTRAALPWYDCNPLKEPLCRSGWLISLVSFQHWKCA